MGLSIPIMYVLIIVIGLIATLPAITYFIIWVLTPYLNVQMFNNLLKNDTIIRDDGKKAIMISGKKKDRESSLYTRKKGLFGPVRYIGIDPTKWDVGSGSRFGGSTLRYQYPGKMWMKSLPRMLASELHLNIAKIPVSEEDTKDNPKAIIKHNKYLHLIANSRDEQALKILRCETRPEIEKFVREYIVIPTDVNKKDEAAYDKMIRDTIEEVEMVHEYCGTLPREVDLGAMMGAYPDNETSYEIFAKITAECELEAKASNNFNVITMFIIIAGIVLIMGLVEVITIVILA